MQPIKTCVLGVGLSGLTFHVPFVLAFSDLFQLHSVLERNPSSQTGKVGERFAVSVKIHRSIEDVLNDPEIELIVVGTPNDTHYAFTKAALEAGKHVLVDKPITTNSNDAKELGALAKANNLVLYAYQNRRWDSDFLTLRRLLNEPKTSPRSLGNIFEFESHYDRFRNELKGSWKDGSGCLYDLGSHLIDQCLLLFGRPEKITAFTGNARGLGDPAIDDNFTIFLHYPITKERPNGLTAILRAHILSVRCLQLRYAVRGTTGTFYKYGLDVQEDQLKAMPDPKGIFADAYGREPESIQATVENFDASGKIVRSSWVSEKGVYADLFRNLAGAIRHGEELEVKWDEAIGVIEMIELAYRSSKEGCTLSVPQ